MIAPAVQTSEQRARSARPQLPTFRAVAREQIRATALAVRGAAVIGAAVLSLVALVVVLQGMSLGSVVSLYEWPTLLPGLMGALLPVAVWARDERYGPGFLWTLPVDRQRLALAKLLSGWVWLMAGVIVYALWLLTLTYVSGGQLLPPYTLQVATTPIVAGVSIDPATLRAVEWSPSPLVWAVPFTAATAMYLLGSAVLLGSRYPLRWVIGTALSYTVLAVAFDAARVRFPLGALGEIPSSMLQFLVETRYGLDAVLTGRTGTLSTTAFLTTGERVLVWRGIPNLADWRIATAIWAGVGVLAIWAAISRHGERRRA